ncbi:hypothetical protein FSP39_019905 [Pinctada imbricata]|uniref:CCHC NOA-type domain-containing protein n=1 Tax=Pinctada imbricata TaxID=66713 RepID=A0AA89C2G9_PINIB|nr:hypothetical protein FSP39_019905 [Pinctada imbricata]
MHEYLIPTNCHDNLKSGYRKEAENRSSDSERQKLLDEIGRMTAGLLGAEEAIAYRDQQLKDLKKENENLKSELDNVVPVLKAQAEVWKADFDAERAARETQHHEKEKLKDEIKQLQIRNQQLQDEMESSSKRQFSEMQQKHAPINYQQTLQQRLGVTPPPTGGYPQYNPQGAHNFAYPHANPHPGSQGVTYPPQYSQMHPNPYQPYPEHARPGGQNVPKCGQLCPDMDTLQIHVLECIEQENTV